MEKWKQLQLFQRGHKYEKIFVVLAINEIHTDPALDLSSHCEIYT